MRKSYAPRRKTSKTSTKPRRSVVQYATKQYVKRIMPKVEVKQQWQHSNEVVLSTLAQGTLLTSGPAIGQGVSAGERIGNVVHLNAINFKGALNNNSGSESMVRWVIVGFPSSNGNPTLNLFRNASTGTSAAVSAVNGLDAMYYPLNTLELTIMFDKVYSLAGSATGNSAANVKLLNKTVQLGRRKVEFKSTAQSYGNTSWMYASIMIAADSNDDTTTGTGVEVSLLERLYFTDA